jgi:hypothetical protein
MDKAVKKLGIVAGDEFEIKGRFAFVIYLTYIFTWLMMKLASKKKKAEQESEHYW